ncbi:uncharacterized protein L969DRAFT_95221 [Mixia osmundae IAM 14324]|uniref:Uncharacterized protein n=1 Tax=Mixia osmundae (strain CBS 9802 / IAM 14324 / JCM 22182 / KY 12970) TaxID=764103 RepID=G7E6T3_MIXOS|nr:uncharacterized protein L969DRAFT_95221 [Mixia osmundae IAM 14324]KEI39074.1 hypothetical protein L969DRAFT_95221 [Mixia osmundae IAM 14324]GAA98543.1 hypothetical protein E5Q_05230 [Mixia osmundae IAM 14324]
MRWSVSVVAGFLAVVAVALPDGFKHTCIKMSDCWLRCSGQVGLLAYNLQLMHQRTMVKVLVKPNLQSAECLPGTKTSDQIACTFHLLSFDPAKLEIGITGVRDMIGGHDAQEPTIISGLGILSTGMFDGADYMSCIFQREATAVGVACGSKADEVVPYFDGKTCKDFFDEPQYVGTCEIQLVPGRMGSCNVLNASKRENERCRYD